MKFIRIHPLTVPVLLFFCLFEKSRNLPFLYIFILLHELSHALFCFLLGEKCNHIHLLPWGCILTLSKIPSGKKSVLIFLAGPLLNIIMYLAGLFPKENLALAVFNLLPVMPLDGGAIVNILFPHIYFYIAISSICALFIFSFYLKLFPLLPLVLSILLFSAERAKAGKIINDKILHHIRQK